MDVSKLAQDGEKVRVIAPIQAPVPATRSPGRPLSVMVSGLIGLGVAVLAVVLLFGRVEGVEFSAGRFARRHFFYYQLPFFQLQISPATVRTIPDDLALYLRSKKFLPPAGTAPDRWDVTMATAGLRHHRGDALLLAQYLDAENADGDLRWLEWTKKHAQQARQLWPVVARMARKNLYVLVPELLRIADRETDPTRLKAGLDRYAGDQTAAFAEAKCQVGDHRSAVDLYTTALEYQPHSTRLLHRRADALEAIGQLARAADDRRAADEPELQE